MKTVKTKLTAEHAFRIIKRAGRKQEFKTYAFDTGPRFSDMQVRSIKKAGYFKIGFTFMVIQGKLQAVASLEGAGIDIKWKPSRGEELRERVAKFQGYGLPHKQVKAAIAFLDSIVA